MRRFVLLEDRVGSLRKVVEALEDARYERVDRKRCDDWTVLWSYSDPFRNAAEVLTAESVRSNQLINRYPANFFSSKSMLATNDLACIPLAFGLPEQLDAFRDAAERHPDTLWVRKNRRHGGVRITTPREVEFFLETAVDEIFVQQLVSPPHLIHRRKWDLGVYVLVTSLVPLRIYVYDDLLVRFCNQDFPVGSVPTDVDSYVIGGDYTSPWELEAFHSCAGHFARVKDMLTHHFQVHEATDLADVYRRGCLRPVYDVISMYAREMEHWTRGWPDGQYQFFELYRFDFIFDDQLTAFLMEANMSPNLSASAHPGLDDMFSRITHDTVSLLGLHEGPAHRRSLIDDPERAGARERRNRRGWVPLTEDDVYDDTEGHAPTAPIFRRL